MMQLTDKERAYALDVLHACGIEGSDATTGLDAVCKLATAPTLHDWLVENNHLQSEPAEAANAELSATYGHDAVRHAHALTVHMNPADRELR